MHNPTPEQIASALAYADGCTACTGSQTHLKVLAEAVPRWIDVTERKPIDGQRVLCVDASKGEIHSCEYRTWPLPRYVHKHTGQFWSRYITHWMPAPDVPMPPADKATT